METTEKREPLLIITESKGVGKSFISENKDDAFMLTEKFMHNLHIGDKFTLNKKQFFVKRIGKFYTEIGGKKKSFKKLTLKTHHDKVEMFINDDEKSKRSIKKIDDSITFYFLGGIHGNPRSRQRNSDAKQYNFLRDVEGVLITDLINRNNPLHEPSEIYKKSIL